MDHIGHVICAPYEPSIAYMFQGIEDAEHPGGPFSDNRLRILVVDNILNNVSFLTRSEQNEVRRARSFSYSSNVNIAYDDDERVVTRDGIVVVEAANNNESEADMIDDYFRTFSLIRHKMSVTKNLPFMLQGGYFDDAFVLHDESSHSEHLRTLLLSMDQQAQHSDHDALTHFRIFEENQHHEDKRLDLHDSWASMGNMFNEQPMWKIRNYFGEYSSLYFAWLGVLITSLWVPSLIGICFFITGCSFYR